MARLQRTTGRAGPITAMCCSFCGTRRDTGANSEASGVFFSADRFPDAVQPIIRVMPLTALVDALRKVILEGIGVVGILPELGIIVVWTVVTFFLALVWFRWN